MLSEHDYTNMAAATDSDVSEDHENMEEGPERNPDDKTPVPSPNPKKLKRKYKRDSKNQSGTSNEDILGAVQTLIKRFDVQDERLTRFERKIEETLQKVKENKEEINNVKVQMIHLQKENDALKQMCLEHARYKRRWNLRLIGLPEKEREETKEVIVGILTRILPVSVDKIRETVDTVHRLGRRNDVATNMLPRPVIIQFALRTVRDEVWRRSREAKVCKDMGIRFKEDFSREDREARAKLWPKVEEARKNGKKASLREGYALIEGKRIVP